MRTILTMGGITHQKFTLSLPCTRVDWKSHCTVSFKFSLRASQVHRFQRHNGWHTHESKSTSLGTFSGTKMGKNLQTLAVMQQDSAEDLFETDGQEEFIPIEYLKVIVSEVEKQAIELGEPEGIRLAQRAREESEKSPCSKLEVLTMMNKAVEYMNRVMDASAEEDELLFTSHLAEELTGDEVWDIGDGLGTEKSQEPDEPTVSGSSGDIATALQAVDVESLEDIRQSIAHLVTEIECGFPERIVTAARKLRDEVMAEDCTLEQAEQIFTQFDAELDTLNMDELKASLKDEAKYNALSAPQQFEQLKLQVHAAISELEEMGDRASLSLAENLRREVEGSEWSPPALMSVLQKTSKYVQEKGEAMEAHELEAWARKEAEDRGREGGAHMHSSVPVQHVNLQNLAELRQELNSLAVEVLQLYRDGEKEAAQSLVEANLEAVTQQVEAGVQGLEQASMMHVLCHLSITVGYPEAEKVLEKTNSLVAGLHVEPSLIWDLLVNVADQNKTMGNFLEASLFYQQTLTALEDREDPLSAHKYALMGLVDSLCQAGQWERATSALQRYIALWRAEEGSHGCEALALQRYLGAVLMEQGDHQGAMEALLGNLEALGQVGEEQSREAGLTLLFVARVQQKMGAGQEAVEAYHQGIAILRREGDSLSESDRQALEVGQRRLEQLQQELSQMDDIEEALEAEVASRQARFEESGDKADAESLLLASLALTQHLQEALQFTRVIPLLRVTVQLAETHLADTGMATNPLCQLAICHWMEGDMGQAEEAARKNLDLCLGMWDPSEPVVGNACGLLARILVHANGSREEIEGLLEVDLANKMGAFGGESEEVLDALGALLEAAEMFQDTERVENIKDNIELLEGRLGVMHAARLA